VALTLSEKREKVLLLERKRANAARDGLTQYCKYIDIPGAPMDPSEDCEAFYPDKVTPAAHHIVLNDVLEKVERGEIRRLMVYMPPGSAKSTYSSVTFPTWYMGRNPGKNIIATSYGSDLAKKFGRKCRQIVRSPEFEEVMGCRLVGDNAAVDDWSITNGATYMSGGILSGITGNRADGVIIDDPIKGREEADSEAIRDKTWNEYKSSLRTRLKPNGFIILIMTRWHEEDLAGRILPEDYDGASGWVRAQDGENWYVINVPAEAEREDDPIGRAPGEWLWTEWFSVEHWEQERRTQDSRNWAALYQQRPAPDGGILFTDDMMRWYDTPPNLDTLRFYGASDYAVSDGKGDYTVHGIAGIDPNDDLYLLDWWRAQVSPDKGVDAWADMAKQWRPVRWGEDKAQIEKTLGPFIDKRGKEMSVSVVREKFPTVGDKVQRAQSIRGRMGQGKVYLPRNAPWTKDLVAELLSFPNGRNDDQVDVLSLFGRMLTTMRPDRKPTRPRPTRTNNHYNPHRRHARV
jgi:predicted phage terminase large subunit-like protein